MSHTYANLTVSLLQLILQEQQHLMLLMLLYHDFVLMHTFDRADLLTHLQRIVQLSCMLERLLIAQEVLLACKHGAGPCHSIFWILCNTQVSYEEAG